MMPDIPSGQALFLVGPTASGKTDAAHELAREWGCEILSADSMLVYKGMDIGTAKPDAAQRREVRYWGLDLVEPGEPFSLALFQNEAARACAENAKQGRGLIVVGGTGLYVKALIEGLDQGPPPNPELRSAWEKRVSEEGVASLRNEIRSRYPSLAASMTESDLNNPRRLMRALELGEAGIATVKRGWSERPDSPVITALSVPPDLLRSRIERRVDRMWESGFADEVKGLMEKGLMQAPTASQAIGYAEAIGCLTGL